MGNRLVVFADGAGAGEGKGMKVGVNTLFLIPGEVGGSETYLRDTLTAMLAGYPDIQFVLFTNNENDKALRMWFGGFKQAEYERLDLNACNRYARILREQTTLARKVRESGVDLLWSPGYTAPFLSPCPQVVTVHDMQYKTHPQDLRLMARIATDVLVRIATRRCRRIIAVSNFSKTEIVKFTAARTDKIDVIYEAAARAFGERLEANELKTRLADLVPTKTPFILAISNTYPHKNMHAVVNAFREMAGDIPHSLVMVGSPRLGEPEVQKALNGLTDRNRVIRLKTLPRDSLIVLYQGADCFVFPSVYEGFGLPVLEAMMAGVPVITTGKGAIPEVGGDNVVYFDPSVAGDLVAKIKEVLAWSAATRQAFVEKARQRAQTFSWERTASETVASFKHCLIA
jgi:glycosyltransferase involved in cell wall biosynthesis